MWLAAKHPARVKSLSLHSAWPSTDPFVRVVVEGWRIIAQALSSITDMVIKGIFPWCFTPELYAARPEYIDSLADRWGRYSGGDRSRRCALARSGPGPPPGPACPSSCRAPAAGRSGPSHTIRLAGPVGLADRPARRQPGAQQGSVICFAAPKVSGHTLQRHRLRRKGRGKRACPGDQQFPGLVASPGTARRPMRVVRAPV